MASYCTNYSVSLCLGWCWRRCPIWNVLSRSCQQLLCRDQPLVPMAPVVGWLRTGSKPDKALNIKVLLHILGGCAALTLRLTQAVLQGWSNSHPVSVLQTPLVVALRDIYFVKHLLCARHCDIKYIFSNFIPIFQMRKVSFKDVNIPKST